MNCLFEVKDLHVTYRRPGEKPLEAVRGVNFTLAEGETLGIVGESGSGKSTIAKALMLLQPVSGGEILFCGKNIAAFDRAACRAYRRDVQMVFQDAVGSLNPRMTIRQALDEALRLVRDDAARRKGEALLSLLSALSLLTLPTLWTLPDPYPLPARRPARALPRVSRLRRPGARAPPARPCGGARRSAPPRG